MSGHSTDECKYNLKAQQNKKKKNKKLKKKKKKKKKKKERGLFEYENDNEDININMNYEDIRSLCYESENNYEIYNINKEWGS